MAALDFRGIGLHASTRYEARRNESTTLASCPYFTTRLLALDRPIRKNLEDVDTFVVYMCVDGLAAVRAMDTIVPMHAGECVLVPAVAESAELFVEGNATLLEVTIDPDGWDDEERGEALMARFVGEG